MKLFVTMVVLLLLTTSITCNSQPNTTSSIKVGIVNPQEGKTYRLFCEITTAIILPGRLVEGGDFMSPSVVDLEYIITDWVTSGDTLFGKINIPDQEYVRYIQGALVQVGDISRKYSGMSVSNWVTLDMLEPKPAGFIFRRE